MINIYLVGAVLPIGIKHQWTFDMQIFFSLQCKFFKNQRKTYSPEK